MDTAAGTHAQPTTTTGPFTVRGLNHAVLYVSDIDRAVEFYTTVLGFSVVSTIPEAGAAFLRAAGSENHHDLGLFGLGPAARHPGRGHVGLYHLAWQVPTIDDLAAAAPVMAEAGALVGASDHGATKSLYGRDPDGNEFEVMWMLPREAWGSYETEAVIEPLNLAAEVERWGAVTTA